MTIRQYLTRLNYRSTPIFPRISTVFKVALFSLAVITATFYVTQTYAADSLIKIFTDGVKTPSLDKWFGRDVRNTGLMSYADAFIETDKISPELVNGQIPKDGRFFTSAPGGVIGYTNGLIGQLYNQPASGIEYLADMKNEFLGIKTVNAQGVGFKGLQPILPIWRAFRNVVYLLSSLIFIAIGVMIMLRVKISAQAVISLQTAIPQLVTALILVTFSYAIAGLMIDISNFIMGAVIAILFSSQDKNLGGNLWGPGILDFIPVARDFLNPFNFKNLADGNLFTVAWLLLIPAMMTALLGTIVSWLIGFTIAFPLLGPIGGIIAGPALGTLFGTAGAVIVLIVLAVMISIWLIQFLFGLFKCYATLLFKIILAPLEIGMGALPNSKMGFGTWALDVIANLSVFPISLLFLIISNVIITNIIWGGATATATEILKGNLLGGGMWVPPMLGGDLVAFGLRPMGGIAAMAVGVSTLMLLAKLPDMIPQFIFMLKPSPWGTAIGEGLKAPMGMISGAGKFGWNTGVDVAAGGIATGAGPFHGVNLLIEGKSPTGDGTWSKQVSSTLQSILHKK